MDGSTTGLHQWIAYLFNLAGLLIITVLYVQQAGGPPLVEQGGGNSDRPPPPREHREPFLHHGQLEDVVLNHALDEPMPARHVDEPEVSRHISVSAAAWHQVHDSVILFSSPEHAFPEICV